MIAIIVLWILLGIVALIVILLHFSLVAHIKVNGDGVDIKAKYLFFTVYPRAEKPHKPKKSRKRKAKKREEKTIFTDDFDDDFSDLDYEEDVPELLEDIKEADEDTKSIAQSIDDSVEVCEEILSDEVDERRDKFGMDGLEESFNEPVVQKSVDEKKKSKVKKSKKIKKAKKAKADKSDKPEKSKGKLADLKEKYYKYKPYFPMGWKYFKKLLKAVRFTNVKANINVGREDAHEAAIYYGAVQGMLFNTLGMLANIFTVSIKRANVNCVFTKNTINGEFECDVKVRPSTIIAIAVCVAVRYLLIRQKQKCKDKKSRKNAEKSAEKPVEQVVNS